MIGDELTQIILDPGTEYNTPHSVPLLFEINLRCVAEDAQKTLCHKTNVSPKQTSVLLIYRYPFAFCFPRMPRNN